MYPTKLEFEELLKTREAEWIVEHHLFKGTPFYSSSHPDVHNQLIVSISRGLRVPKADICVVGSARIGFSLSPQRFGEPFSQFSDLDVIVVSNELFDLSWLDILTYRQVDHATMSFRTRQSLRSHREKDYIYKGWIYPESVVEALAIGESWLRTFSGLSRIVELADRNVGGRLYKSWQHAMHYHRRSLESLKRTRLDTK